MSSFPLSLIRHGRHLIGAATGDAHGTWAAFTVHGSSPAGQACILPPRFQRDLTGPGQGGWQDGDGIWRRIDPGRSGSFAGFVRPGSTYLWRPGQVQPDVSDGQVRAQVTLNVPVALSPGMQGLLVTEGTLVTEEMLRPLFRENALAALDEMRAALPAAQRPVDLSTCEPAWLMRVLSDLPRTPQVRVSSRELATVGAQVMRMRPRKGQVLRALLLRGGEVQATVECPLTTSGRGRFHPEVAQALNGLSAQPGDMLAVLACDDPHETAPVDLIGRAGVLHFTK